MKAWKKGGFEVVEEEPTDVCGSDDCAKRRKFVPMEKVGRGGR